MSKKIIKLTESQLKQIIENKINKLNMVSNIKLSDKGGIEILEKGQLKENTSSKIISVERPTQDLDVEKEFRMYKYAIPEHEPIKLSNNNYLHVYRVTKYSGGLHGDPDEEQAAYEREL
mgnify:CR=1 FL=1